MDSQEAKAKILLLSISENPSNEIISSDKKPPRQKQRDQEKAILAAIKNLGYDAKCIPRIIHSKPGVKSAVHKRLISDDLFSRSTAFDKAWERLRKEGSIEDEK